MRKKRMHLVSPKRQADAGRDIVRNLDKEKQKIRNSILQVNQKLWKTSVGILVCGYLSCLSILTADAAATNRDTLIFMLCLGAIMFNSYYMCEIAHHHKDAENTKRRLLYALER